MKLHDLKVHEARESAIPGVEMEYASTLRRFGFKRQPNGTYYKTAGVGTIEIDKHGHWIHSGVDLGYEGGADYEGTTASTLDRHLSHLLRVA